MSALDPREAERLNRFLDLVMFPALPPDEDTETHRGLARGLLASPVKWQPLDLAFLRLMAACPLARECDHARLMALCHAARERAA